ncbi:hypothetical protein EST38_g8109 [Candolleomyces aberdarensis]|uniref:Fungal-type protein kinase domain-containing protein n=1 Tax=Candolleomyces aberdarensis TaxID=2316362 RepID=A0A4Q2DFL6_9AGAR|nr:hypothetical protein EST38_g8109 [Candolleomyces aberdarensis]
MFAEPLSVGIDPSINRVSGSSEGLVSYVYALDDKDSGGSRQRYFRTLDVLYSPPQTLITGRATRVWEAQEVRAFDDPTPVEAAPSTVIMREVWTDASAKTESEIQFDIFADLNSFGQRLSNGVDPEQFLDFEPDLKTHIKDLFVDEKYKEYFLTVIGECKGPVNRPPVPGYEEGADIFHFSRPGYIPANVGQKFSSAMREDIERRYQQSYRLVYKEHCYSLNDFEPSLGLLPDAFAVLSDCLIALVLLYCAGWVHRDISPGNILLWRGVDGQPRCKIGDLEYAKKFPPSSTLPDIKTGTAGFIPVEMVYKHHFYTVVQEDLTEEDDKIANWPLQHHFQHDAESLCKRKILDTMKAGVDDEPANSTSKRIRAQSLARTFERT